MFDARTLEGLVERFFETLEGMTKQFARLAYAEEEKVIRAGRTNSAYVDPCKECGCRLLNKQTDYCPACRSYLGVQ